MHQISSHTITEIPFQLSKYTNINNNNNSLLLDIKSVTCESPALTFEEFLIFLCAYSYLFYEGKINIPSSAPPLKNIKSIEILQQKEYQEWFEKWQIIMNTSITFKKLITEYVFPILLKNNNTSVPLLACPSESRIRDKYISVFTLDIILALQNVEDNLLELINEKNKQLKLLYETNKNLFIVKSELIIEALQILDLLPEVINEEILNFTLSDIMPTINKNILRLPNSNSNSNSNNGNIINSQLLSPISTILNGSTNSRSVTSSPSTIGTTNTGTILNSQRDYLVFPQWEWVLCVVSFHAIEYAINHNPNIPNSFDLAVNIILFILYIIYF